MELPDTARFDRVDSDIGSMFEIIVYMFTTVDDTMILLVRS